jgi:4-hydroxybenzoate polyprenyltransferase
MTITINLAALRRTHWQEYALRFLFGGLVTAAAGLIAQRFGPSTGGLLLAFPAIFPAGATLVEKHQIEKKHEAGLSGSRRGAEAAAVDAIGAALGCFGLIGFAVVISQLLEHHGEWPILVGATIAWLVISTAIWRLRMWCKHRAVAAVR